MHPFNPAAEQSVLLVASLLQAGKPQSIPITQSTIVTQSMIGVLPAKVSLWSARSTWPPT